MRSSLERAKFELFSPKSCSYRIIIIIPLPLVFIIISCGSPTLSSEYWVVPFNFLIVVLLLLHLFLLLLLLFLPLPPPPDIRG